MKKVDLISIGRVIRSEGKNGTLKIKLYLKNLREPFFKKIFILREGEVREYELEDCYLARNSLFLKLKGVNSLGEAEALRGREIKVRVEDFPSLEEGTYYDFELLGCQVETTLGKPVGEVLELITIGESSLLVVDTGTRKVEVPLVEAICKKIDPSAKKIVIDPPEGLLELNEV